MLKLLKYILPLILLSSCAVNQDYHFNEGGTIKMDVGIDMSQLMSSLPKNGDSNDMDFSNLQDSLKKNGTLDSLKEHGISEINFTYDTATYVMQFDMLFDDMKSFTGYMNKDRKEDLKPIEVLFDKKQFGVKNCTSLISQDMMEAFNKDKKEENKGEDDPLGDMNMNDFFKFKTTYHFPYEVDSYKSESGKGLLSEDRKSITFDNTLDEFTDSNFNGDLNVKFK